MAFLPLSAIVPRLSILGSDCILYVDFTHETFENGTIYKTAFRKLTFHDLFYPVKLRTPLYPNIRLFRNFLNYKACVKDLVATEI